MHIRVLKYFLPTSIKHVILDPYPQKGPTKKPDLIEKFVRYY